MEGESKAVFEKATKKRARLRMAIDGPSGSGKTYTGLLFATALANGGQIAVIDTERGSASKYADEFDFDVLELTDYHPENYIAGIEMAEKAGYVVLLIDSLSHAWEGKGGVLELHDDEVKRQRVRNSFTAWKEVTPIHRRLIDAMLQSDCHIIATMRTKTEWVLQQDSRGKTVPERVGTKAIQRQGVEYEFDIVGDMDLKHTMVIGKSRCRPVSDAVVDRPDGEWFEAVEQWLTTGVDEPEPQRTKRPKSSWSENEDRIKFIIDKAIQDLGLSRERATELLGDAKQFPTGQAAWEHLKAQAEPHWVVKNAKWFWARAREVAEFLGQKGAVHEEFGVKSMKDFKGSKADAELILNVMDNALNTKGLGLVQLKQALGVSHMHEWLDKENHAYGDAVKLLDTWVELQMKASEDVEELDTGENSAEPDF